MKRFAKKLHERFYNRVTRITQECTIMRDFLIGIEQYRVFDN